jgi:phosphoenolpyruvate-protein kinase (PTS system EI component)
MSEFPHLPDNSCTRFRRFVRRIDMNSSHNVTPGQRLQMIAEAAYFRAERRGFGAGDLDRDWLEAEAEVDARLEQHDADHMVDRLEEGLAVATKKIAELKRRASRLKTEARAEWQQDIAILVTHRDALRAHLKAIRAQGEHAGHALRQQAQHAWEEIRESVERIGAKKRDR